MSREEDLTRVRHFAVVALVGLLLSIPAMAGGQTMQIAPFIGYRAGGSLYEVVTGSALDVDGGSAGLTVDVFVQEGTSATFLYSRQEARLETRAPSGGTRTVGRIPVEHWHVGATQELDGGLVRPFLAGTAGLTRFGGTVGSDVRFSAAGHAGVKFLATDHVGARLDASLFAVFVEGGIGGVACGNGFCAFDIDALIAWQGEFRAALMISF